MNDLVLNFQGQIGKESSFMAYFGILGENYQWQDSHIKTYYLLERIGWNCMKAMTLKATSRSLKPKFYTFSSFFKENGVGYAFESNESTYEQAAMYCIKLI